MKTKEQLESSLLSKKHYLENLRAALVLLTAMEKNNLSFLDKRAEQYLPIGTSLSIHGGNPVKTRRLTYKSLSNQYEYLCWQTWDSESSSFIFSFPKTLDVVKRRVASSEESIAKLEETMSKYDELKAIYEKAIPKIARISEDFLSILGPVLSQEESNYLYHTSRLKVFYEHAEKQ